MWSACKFSVVLGFEFIFILNADYIQYMMREPTYNSLSTLKTHWFSKSLQKNLMKESQGRYYLNSWMPSNIKSVQSYFFLCTDPLVTAKNVHQC